MSRRELRAPRQARPGPRSGSRARARSGRGRRRAASAVAASPSSSARSRSQHGDCRGRLRASRATARVGAGKAGCGRLGESKEVRRVRTPGLLRVARLPRAARSRTRGSSRACAKRSPSARTRLLSTSEPMASRSPPHTSSTASSVHPPTKTDRRRKSACSSSSRRSKLQPIVSRSARCRDGGIAGAGGEQLQPVLQPGEHPRRGQHLHPRRRQLDRERQAVEMLADLGDSRPGRPRRAENRGARRVPVRGTR